MIHVCMPGPSHLAPFDVESNKSSSHSLSRMARLSVIQKTPMTTIPRSHPGLVEGLFCEHQVSGP